MSKKQYEDLLEEEVKLKAVHGGLETGVIGAMVPGIQMVSIGPRIQNPHTPAERLNIEDVGVLYELLKQISEEFQVGFREYASSSGIYDINIKSSRICQPSLS